LVAVAIVIPLAIAFLQHINWVPLIGNFAASVARQMERTQSSGVR
jgi:hypothetical protein